MKVAHAFLPCLLLLSSCVDVDAPLDEELGEASQEVGSTALNTFTCSTYPYCIIPLGSKQNRACFLGGIRGDAAHAYVAVLDDDVDYQLLVYPKQGSSITVTTVCVASVTNVTTSFWYMPMQATQISTSPTARCFLTKMSASSGGMTNYNDTVKIWRDPTTSAWFLNAYVQTGTISTGAICFDTTNQGEWSWGQGVPGSITGNLGSNATGGVACGLTELGGVFTTNSASDGVHVDYVARTKQWIWTLVNYKHAAANCIK